ncbi:MAG: hypothetical protein J6A53_05615, partial [Clostridia bacterium]|nr:hypothetical protein [Clostridia bacterium]
VSFADSSLYTREPLTQGHSSLRGSPAQAERARVKGENPSILALVFHSVDMSTSLARYIIATLQFDMR